MPRLSAAKVVLIALLTALLGFAGGYFFYANTVARYDTTSSVCVAMQEAVKANMLNTLEVKQIGTLAGSTLKRNYSSVASKLSIAPESVQSASEYSVCSQFLIGVYQSR